VGLGGRGKLERSIFLECKEDLNFSTGEKIV
jgi:hypothetical protein